MNVLSSISLILVIIGALNWGSIGISNLNFIELLQNTNLIKAIYIGIGISAVYLILKYSILNSVLSKQTGPLNNPDYFGILERQQGSPVVDDVKIRYNASAQELLNAVNAQ
jgi:uncharacterized protein